MVGKKLGGGGMSTSFFKRTLHRRVEYCREKYDDADQLIEYLRATFPEYGRQKLQPFSRNVHQVLHLFTPSKKDNNCSRSFSSNIGVEDSDGFISVQSQTCKRARKTDKCEEKLQLLETQHLMKKQKGQKHHAPSISSSSVSTSSSSEEEQDGAVSTSEDAIYEEKFEAEFDLTKSMLRDFYGGSNSKRKSAEDVEKNVELEVVNNKTENVGLICTDRSNPFGKTSSDQEATTSKNSNNAEDMHDNKGPSFKDFGGISTVLEELEMEVLLPLYHPHLLQQLGVRLMSGILLHGPPGCGKTRLAHAIANEVGLPFYKISATELVSGISGASEENIRGLFSKAYRTAPSIVFIDELDAVASKRENLQREMERRIVTQLMTCMDESHKPSPPDNDIQVSENSNGGTRHILVIGATNRPDAIDPALRRPGRFDREIYLGVPDENSRVEILSVLTRELTLEGAFDSLKIARMTPGFVGADLVALVNKAGNLAMKRNAYLRKCELMKKGMSGKNFPVWWKHPWPESEIKDLKITMIDFEEAATVVQPSSKREGFSAIPNVRWEDLGGLDTLRHRLDSYIVRQIKFPEDFKEIGGNLEMGFLLYGPPGCGKTSIAKAVANEAGASFIHIKGPELLNKYVGESELAVRTIFTRARTCSPCILFIDEVDALTTVRGREGGWVVERLVNQLLIELDGAEQRRGVYVIGATNRPEVMDPAFLRPGRFGKLVYLPLPTPDQRGLILRTLCREKQIEESLDLMEFAKSDACKNYSGADLDALVKEASLAALEEKWNNMDNTSVPLVLKEIHFELASKKISPSVSDEQIQYYELLSKNFKAA